MPIPEIGSTIYIETSMSIDHGQDDILGGRATVKAISYMTSAGRKTAFVETEEVPGRRFNWDQNLEPIQESLNLEYGDHVAAPDPDFPDGWSDKDRLDWLRSTYGREIATKVFRPRKDGF